MVVTTEGKEIFREYLENVSGSHNKFYEVTILQAINHSHNYVIIGRYGKIGNKGRSQVKDNTDFERTAFYSANELIRSKIATGYYKVTPKKENTLLDKIIEQEEICLDRFSDLWD